MEVEEDDKLRLKRNQEYNNYFLTKNSEVTLVKKLHTRVIYRIYITCTSLFLQVGVLEQSVIIIRLFDFGLFCRENNPISNEEKGKG